MLMCRIKLVPVVTVVVCMVHGTLAQTKPAAPGATGAAMVGFRGNGSCVYSAKNIPTTWDVAGGTNILWSAPLPERALSEPICVAGKVLVCCEPELLVCYAAATGKELWKVEVNALEGEPPERKARIREAITNAIEIWKSGAEWPKEKNDPLNAQFEALKKEYGIEPVKNWIFFWQGYAYNTPFSDGTHVWVRYGTGSIGCYDLDGKKLWLRRTPVRSGLNIQSSQMQVIAGKVVFVESVPPNKQEKTPETRRLTGLAATTGEEVWHSKPFPPGDHADASGLSTVHLDGKACLVTSGGQVIDPESGEILGDKFGNWGYCVTVYAEDDTLYFGPQRVRLKMKGGRVVTDDVLPVEKTSERVVAYNGTVYLARGESLAYFPTNAVWERKMKFDSVLSYNYRPKGRGKGGGAPIVADGMLFCPATEGKLAVVKPGPKPELVALNSFPDPITSSPAAVDGRLFVRTTTSLYCIGKK